MHRQDFACVLSRACACVRAGLVSFGLLVNEQLSKLERGHRGRVQALRRAQREERHWEEGEKMIQIDDHAQRKQNAHSVFSTRVCVCAIAADSKEWEESERGRVSESVLESVTCDDDARTSGLSDRVRVLRGGEREVDDWERERERERERRPCNSGRVLSWSVSCASHCLSRLGARGERERREERGGERERARR